MSVKETWYTDEAKSIIHDRLGIALEEMSEDIEIRAKDKCPVDTGKLQESIRHETNKYELTAEIGTDVEYAKYVEFGTVKMKDQPYLRPSAHQTDASKFFKDII